MNKRDNFIYVFIGTNRTGKSATVRKQIIIWKKANPGKSIFCHDPQRRFRDLADVFITPENENWAVEMCKQRNCLLVIDDFRKLNESSHPAQGLKLLMYDFCDYNMDIMAVFHNPADVLTCISSHATHYFIFFTNAREGKFKEKIPAHQLCTVASEEVNKYVKVYGRGGLETNWCFPYIWVDTFNGTLSAINMSRQMSKIK